MSSRGDHLETERVALLGGSFNPPHVAHQMLCLWALSTGRADQVWLVPTFEHAFGKQLVSFEHRVNMCELALDPFGPGQAQVCTIEAELETPSRTLVTLQALSGQFPGVRFSLLVGADILEQKHKWFRFDEIERSFEVVSVGRAGHGPADAQVSLPDVSSSRIRQGLATGQDLTSVLPSAVMAYIRRHGLYA